MCQQPLSVTVEDSFPVTGQSEKSSDRKMGGCAKLDMAKLWCVLCTTSGSCEQDPNEMP